MSDETTLLSCPFCGGEAFYNPGYNGGNVECRECGAEGAYKLTEAEAIAAWNTRSAKPCYATDHTHDGCKYSVNRGWVENVAHGTLTAEQVRETVLKHGNVMGHRFYGDWQAIADELNAKLGSVTCEFVVKDNMNESEGMGDVWIECSACHCQFDYYADDWLMKMSYCPNCSARNRKAVER